VCVFTALPACVRCVPAANFVQKCGEPGNMAYYVCDPHHVGEQGTWGN
jgi:hypothetical protein